MAIILFALIPTLVILFYIWQKFLKERLESFTSNLVHFILTKHIFQSYEEDNKEILNAFTSDAEIIKGIWQSIYFWVSPLNILMCVGFYFIC